MLTDLAPASPPGALTCSSSFWAWVAIAAFKTSGVTMALLLGLVEKRKKANKQKYIVLTIIICNVMHAPHSHMSSNHPPKVSTDLAAICFALSPRAATDAASETAEEDKLSLVLLLGLGLVEKRKQTNKTKNKGSAQLLNNNNNNNNKQ